MTTTVNALAIRKRLGRFVWGVPEEFGPDGWRFDQYDDDGVAARIIVTTSDVPGDPRDWVHASMSRRDQVPSYEDLCALRDAVFRDGYAYQVFAPPADHINIHPYTLHLWGLASGERVLPDFGAWGSI